MKTIALISSLFAVSLAHAWSPGIAPTMPVTNLEVDTSSRNDVLSFYQNVYIASQDFASKIQWTGNSDSCNAGTISQDFVNQVHRRVNYYRALAGVPASITMNNGSKVLIIENPKRDSPAPYTPDPSTTKEFAAQQSALLVTKMNALTHTPAKNEICFTEAAGNGSECGNIAIGLFGPDAIDGYIREDKDNPAAGHRRWIFLDEATNFATGDIPAHGSRRASNSLYVFQRPTELTTQTPQFVAWPYAGKFPRQHHTEYWSLSYPNADFKEATVSVTKNGQPVAIASINRETGFGHNSIVWQIPSIHSEKLSDDDSTYSVTVAKIGGGGPTSYTYDITFFNANHLTTPPTLTGANTVAPGGSRNFTIGPVDIAEEYRLEIGKKSALAPTVLEGGEDATQSMIIPGPVTGAHYQLRSTTYRRSGLKSLNLTFTDGKQTEQWVEFNRIFYPKAGAKINFYRRLSFMNSITTFAAQYCINDDGRWIDIPGSAVSGTTKFSNPVETNTAFSSRLSYNLPVATIGQATRIRLLVRKEEHIVDLDNPRNEIFATNAPNTASGAFIDDVTFTNMDWLSTRLLHNVPKDSSSVTFNSTTLGEPLVSGATYTLRLQPRVGNLWMTSSNAQDITVNSNMAPTLDAIAGPIILEEDADTQVVPLSGISGGLEETQAVTITATSSNPTLIPNPTVSYSSPSTTGQLTFRPNPNAFGSALITVTVNDGQATNNRTSRTFEVQVTPVNDAPIISAIANRTINEDAATRSIPFTISDVDSPLNTITVRASSDHSELVPASAITLSGTTASRSIAIRPPANRYGVANITLTASDGTTTSTRTFTLTVNPVNDLPTLNIIPNLIFPEDSPTQVINLTGVSAGAWEDQQAIITAVSSNPAIIPHPTVRYQSPATSGSLDLSPLPDAFGSVTITVTISDGQPLNHTLVRKFRVRITPINDAPTMTQIESITLDEDVRSAPLPFTISDKETAATRLRITRLSSNPTLIPVANIILGGAGPNRTIVINPALHQSGSSTIQIIVSDGSLTASTTFTVTVNPINDAPTLTAIANPKVLPEDRAQLIIPLRGITSGAPNEPQTLTVSATSSNPELLPDPVVTYVSPAATGSLTLRPIANASGSSVISVTVSDGAEQNHSITRTFTLTVRPVNDAPTISTIAPISLVQGTTSQAIPFVVNDVDHPVSSLVISTATSRASLIPASGIVIGGQGSDRTLTLTAAPNALGTATITISAFDGTATTRRAFAVSIVRPPAARPQLTASNTESDLSLPYNIEYLQAGETITYLAARQVKEMIEEKKLLTSLPLSELMVSAAYHAEYSDDGETWFTDGVEQEQHDGFLWATVPMGENAERLIRWKITSTEP